MMEARPKKPGSVRLNAAQYAEMDRLGFDNESAYVKYKMEQGQSKLEVLKTPSGDSTVRTLPMVTEKAQGVVADQLTIQRLSMENRNLQKQLEQLRNSNEETLNGVHHKVHVLLQEELQKRDTETLKTAHAEAKKQIGHLEQQLAKAQKETDAKQEEIKALVKKLGFVELGKALLPGAISGLAKQYPKQMKGIAGTLGRLGLSDPQPEETPLDEEQQHWLHIITYLKELCTEEQCDQLVQLLVRLGEQLKDDDQLLQKLHYYLSQLQKASSAPKEDPEH